MKSRSLCFLTAGAMVVSFTLVGFAQVCAPQPSSWWPGDGNAVDLVAGNNGTLVGGVAFAPGKVGQAFSFNGSGYVTFGITPSIIGTGPLTIELWLKTGGNGFIITQRDSGNFNGEYLLSLGGPPNGFGFAQSQGHVCWSEFGDNRLGFNFCSLSPVNDNIFHHIAVTREVDGTGKIYIDGSLDSSQASLPVTLAPLNVYLGEDVRDFQAPMTGLIDEVTLYKTALSQQAIRTIFLAGSVGKCKVGCVGQSVVPMTVSPTKAGNSGSATVTVTGCGLSGMTLSMSGQPSIIATNVAPDSLGSSIKGTFGLQGRLAGAWDLIVSRADGTTTSLPGAFTITQGGVPSLEIQKIGSPAVPGKQQTYFITVSNTGPVDSAPIPITETVQPWFSLVSSNPPPTTVTQEADTFPQSAIGQNYDAIPKWNLPAIGAGASNTLSYTVMLDPAYPIGRVVRGPSCIGEVPDKCSIIHVGCNASILALCVFQPETCLLLLEEAEACDAALAACIAGEIILCSKVDTTTQGSSDPNDLIGPAGPGIQRWIPKSGSVQYAVLFENVPSATKPATTVGISDRFDPNAFDLNTLTIGLIHFGDKYYTPPAVPLATTALSTDIDLRPSQNLIVRVDASLNLGNGTLSVNFISIDPATGLPPSDVLAGFLAPGASGSVVVKLSPKASLTTGSTITDQSSIVFDANAAILTPQWTNTFDDTKPVSHVNSLASTQTTTAFAISWTGSDVGAGVQDFTVYASDSGGPFTLWQQNVTASSALFTGAAGHTYRFYSLARDLVGNVENPKTTAETTTTILTSPQIVMTKTLARDPSTHEVVVSLSISNAGGAAAQNVQLTIGRINTTSGAPLPQSLGTIAGGGATTATLRLPASIGTAGMAAVLTVGGTYTGGSFNTASKVTLP